MKNVEPTAEITHPCKREKHKENSTMFCYQCEQTAMGTGCSKQRGICGKTAETADLQDLLVTTACGVSAYAHRLAKLGYDDPEAGPYVVQALFTTVTNVNFTPEDIAKWIQKGLAIRTRLAGKFQSLSGDSKHLPPAATIEQMNDIPGMQEQAHAFGIEARHQRLGDDKAGVLDLILFGLKGAAAYADHALRLGKEDQNLYRQFFEILDFIAAEPSNMDQLLEYALKAGDVNLHTMQLLDAANTGKFGHPEPTQVRITPIPGKCILISGHDLLDLHDLLVATAGKGINIYTHGEMLPTNAYPGLKKFPHLVGNYGGAWQEQQKEFDDFPGPILLTTNCLMPPKPSYIDRVYTTGLVSYPGVKHLANGKFAPLIDAALALPGFTKAEAEKRIPIGFARQTVGSVADQVIAAIKAGDVKHVYLIGGCDGAKPGRNYYTEFAEKTPKDTLILTLACGKYRFNKLDLGAIGPFPRVLDMGQCNDSYSAIQVASALAKAVGCGVNDLPLSLILSWYEQKAVAVLLTLLSLGIKNIRIGPSLPAFVTPAVLKVLHDKFGLTPISTPDQDLAATRAAV